jgi:hypothetical protein
VSGVVKIQLLLRPDWRNRAGIDRVCEAAEALGLDATAAGLSTVSLRAPDGVAAHLFGTAVTAGAGELRVPASIEPFVESATVAPPHLRFEDPPDGKERP